MLDDCDANVRRYSDSTLDSGVATVTQMGLLNRSMLATSTGFSLTPDGGNITPDIVSTDPKSADLFALVCYRATKLFLDPKPSRHSWRTRDMGVQTGDVYRYLSDLEAEIHRLENGSALFEGYQSFWGWTQGIAGLPIGEILAQFKLSSPLWTATFTRDGMRVA